MPAVPDAELAKANKYALQGSYIEKFEDPSAKQVDDEDVLCDDGHDNGLCGPFRDQSEQERAHIELQARVGPSATLFDEPDGPQNLMLTQGNGYGERYNSEVIDAVTLPKLVELLTSDRLVDRDAFAELFLLTRYHYVTSHELLELLALRFVVPFDRARSTKLWAAHKTGAMVPIRRHCIRFLLHWLRLCPEDFYGDPKLVTIAQQLLDQLDKTTALANRLAQRLDAARTGAAIVERQAPSAAEQRFVSVNGAVPAAPMARPDYERLTQNPPKLHAQEPLKHSLLMANSPYEIAQQLTEMDWEMYRLVESRELVSGQLATRAKQSTPNATRIIQSFNHTLMWFVKEFLSFECPVQRALCLQKMIEIVEELLHMRNYHRAMSIYAAQAQNAVYAQKVTWNLLPEHIKRLSEQHTTLFSSGGNYKNLRGLVDAAPSPKIPYLGVYITDVVFIHEGNPTKQLAGATRPALNVAPLRFLLSVANRVRSSKKYGTTCYNFWPVPEFQEAFLSKDGLLSDEEAWKIRVRYRPQDQMTYRQEDIECLRKYLECECVVPEKPLVAVRPRVITHVEAFGEYHCANRVVLFDVEELHRSMEAAAADQKKKEQTSKCQVPEGSQDTQTLDE